MLEDARLYPRFVSGLRGFLQEPISIEACRRVIRERLDRRAESFIGLVTRAVYTQPDSPYGRLLRHAGIESGDLDRLVQAEGVEGALGHLHDAGVHLTLEEQRGKTPVRRGSLEFELSFEDLANPLVSGVLRGSSGGSRSPGRTALTNFETLEIQVAYHGVHLSAFDALQRPVGVWHPPIVPGINTVLSQSKLGLPAERWFVPMPLSFKERLLTRTIWALARAARRPVPRARLVPPSQSGVVAGWLAEKRAAGTPGVLATTTSSAARICATAADHGIDISGTLFRMGGEPYTAAKAALVARAGCIGSCHYYMTEAGGQVGVACADPVEPGDVHVCQDKLAVTQRTRRLPTGGTARTVTLTTLQPLVPSILINFETDDFAVLEDRACACEIGTLGLSLHLHGIRSLEKLTGEGVNFLGETLIKLVEDALPTRFGGAATDYQLVELERDGRTRVLVVVSPRVGPVDEREVIREALGFLERSGPAEKEMAAAWRAGETVEVVRAEPRVTSMAKVLPLHLSHEDDF